jgi:hypothetical protein
MTKRARSTKQTGVPSDLSRRTFLERVGRVGFVAAAGTPLLRPRISMAVPVTLSLWSGTEIEPFYKMAAGEYAKTHPGFTLATLSSPPREGSAPIDVEKGSGVSSRWDWRQP